MSDFWRPMTKPKARKPHRCCWCGESIAVGELHCHQTGHYDGMWQSNRWHPECWDDAAEDDYAQDGFTLYSNKRPKPEATETAR